MVVEKVKHGLLGRLLRDLSREHCGGVVLPRHEGAQQAAEWRAILDSEVPGPSRNKNRPSGRKQDNTMRIMRPRQSKFIYFQAEDASTVHMSFTCICMARRNGTSNAMGVDTSVCARVFTYRQGRSIHIARGQFIVESSGEDESETSSESPDKFSFLYYRITNAGGDTEKDPLKKYRAVEI